MRVRDDDIPEVTFHALSPAGLTLDGTTWVGEIPERHENWLRDPLLRRI